MPDARDPPSETPGSQSRPRRESPGTLCREPALRPALGESDLRGHCQETLSHSRNTQRAVPGTTLRATARPPRPGVNAHEAQGRGPAAVGPEVGPAGASSGLFRDL